MPYTHSIEQSSEYLRMALRHLGQHKLPLNPINYAVWYEYVCEANPDLKAALDALLAAGEPVTEQAIVELYRQYIDEGNPAAVDTLRQEIRRILSDVLEDLSTVDGDASRFVSTLDRQARNLGRAENSAAIIKIIETIVQETHLMGNSSERLRHHLEAANQEVHTLRQRLEQVKQEANTDALTGLPNRRSFEGILAREIKPLSDGGAPLCLLMMDIDFFKRVNDNFGHLVGDDVLRVVATTLKDLVKGRDSVARYGGEEFIVLLPATPLSGALILAEQIRKRFEGMQWKKRSSGQSIGSITLSIGVSRFRRGETAEALIQRADEALYQAKNRGRNQVFSALQDSTQRA